MTDEELVKTAMSLVGELRTSHDCTAGSVAAALRTRAGHVYTGICIDTACSLGFCAEHAVIADMLKARESEIETMVAVTHAGVAGALCAAAGISCGKSVRTTRRPTC